MAWGGLRLPWKLAPRRRNMMRDALAPLSEHYLQAFRCEIVSSVRLSPHLGCAP